MARNPRNLLKNALDLRAALAVTVVLLLVTPTVAADEETEPLEQRLLVTLSDMDAQSRLGGPDVEVLHRYSYFPIVLVEVGPSGQAYLNDHPDVLGIEEDLLMEPNLASTIPLIGADVVHGAGHDGSGTAVAILDTGIDRDHPFFAGQLVSEACYSNAGGAGSGVTLCPGGGTAETGAGSADAEIANCMNGASNICRHGSHVAGTAAGDGDGVAGAPGDGVAPGADIIAIQVFTRFNSDGDCSPGSAPCVRTYTSDQILGLERVLALDGTLPSDIVAANMSLGGGESATPCDGDARKAVIDSLLAANIATVISAGNDGFDASVSAPACISSAITVGATTDADNVAGFSNRGTLLDIFAPGTSVVASVPDDTWASMQGTSMAAPHVAGAWAVMRDIYPTASVATILGWLQDNGVAITYSSDGSMMTTPRLDLLAALQPVVGVVDGVVSVDEGQTATNSGTFSDPNGDMVTLSASIGSVVKGASGTWSWSFDALDGPSDTQLVTISATDETGIVGTDTFQLYVDNVAPAVSLDPTQVVAIDEGDTLSVLSSFVDPGVLDAPYVATVDWGHADLGTDPATVVLTNDGPPGNDEGTASAEKQYGDAGIYQVVVSVTDKDGDTGTAAFHVNVGNVDPDALIDLSGATDINGVQTITGEAGEPLVVDATANDPGSDDLHFDWAHGDGATTNNVVLVGPPASDPFPSPDPNARIDVMDTVAHTYAEACMYEVSLVVRDDDLGASDLLTAAVLITGNANESRPTGWWSKQFQHDGDIADFSTDTLECYLAIVRFSSALFDEEVALSTLADADDVYHAGDAKPHEALRRQLERETLTAWLNYADGVFAYGQMVVDTNNDGTADTPFAVAAAVAEATATDPTATPRDLVDARQMMEQANRHGE